MRVWAQSTFCLSFMRASHKLEELQTHFDTTAHLSYITSCCSPQSPNTAATVAAFPLLMPAKLCHTPGHLGLLPHTLAVWLTPLFTVPHAQRHPRPETAVVTTLFQSSYHFLKPYFIFIWIFTISPTRTYHVRVTGDHVCQYLWLYFQVYNAAEQQAGPQWLSIWWMNKSETRVEKQVQKSTTPTVTLSELGIQLCDRISSRRVDVQIDKGNPGDLWTSSLAREYGRAPFVKPIRSDWRWNKKSSLKLAELRFLGGTIWRHIGRVIPKLLRGQVRRQS